MMKRFCAKCGHEFMAESAAVRYCPDCKAEVKKEWQEKQKQYAKNRAAKLGLVNITVYKTDRDIIKEIAEKDNMTVADVIKNILASKQEVKQENNVKQEVKKADVKKEVKKAAKK